MGSTRSAPSLRGKVTRTRDAKTNPAVNEASRSRVLDEIVRRVIEVAQPDRIIVFGSAARGQMGADSDIDLLVIKGGIASRRTLAQQIYVHLFGVSAPLDVIVVTPQDVERFRDRVGSIIGPALREGKEVYAA